ncbi:MAG: septum formation protein Maf [Bdellovibrio sp. CG10_big_fil_rev_8_21_14_0_10_47_8]|nr:MAG: septum formation protein Maf [Bdellovibrio sp. CG10_big_fil_rev_8_21_14_0_10_47_8]
MTPIQLILASESPRRKDLLQKAGFSFHVFSVKVSENLEKNLTVDEQILSIARRKIIASLKSYKSLKTQPFLALSADTMVVLNGLPIGKPRDEEEAADFLRLLSGRKHEVTTAVVLAEGPVPADFQDEDFENLKMRQGVQTTHVHFRPISDKEIREYIMTGEPLDKAGAYGIQGLGGNFVEKIVGPFDNVVGLPMELFKKLLQEGGWIVKPGEHG